MIGVEIDMVVPDSIKAITTYENIFEVDRIEVTDFREGGNEAVFNMYGTRFHLLDENVEYHLIAPKENDPKPMWINIVVPNIKETYDKAMKQNCKEIQPITEMKEMGVINAMFEDPFHYIWMLHQIEKDVSFKERCEILEEKFEENDN